MTQGWHSLLVEYANTCKIEYKSQTGAYHDDRPRGAVVLLPEKVAKPIKPSAYSDEISMCWAKTEHLFLIRTKESIIDGITAFNQFRDYRKWILRLGVKT